MNLFLTVKKICNGPRSFPELIRENSAGRALWHFFILAGLMSFLSAGIASCRFNPEMANACREIFKVTGGFSLSDKGFVTHKTPGMEKKIHIIMSHNSISFDYLPSGKLTSQRVREMAEKANMGILAMKKGVVSWSLVPQEKGKAPLFMVFNAPFFREQKELKIGTRTEEELLKQVNENFSVKENEKLTLRKGVPPFNCKDPELISSTLGAVSTLMAFLISLGGMIVFVLLTVLFFTIIQRMRMRELTFGQNFTLMLYSSFPGVVAGTLYQILELPFLDFQSVFLLVFFFFQLFACAEVYRSLQKGGLFGGDKNNP